MPPPGQVSTSSSEVSRYNLSCVRTSVWLSTVTRPEDPAHVSLNLHLVVVCWRPVHPRCRGAFKAQAGGWGLASNPAAQSSCRLPSSSPPPPLSAAASSPAPPSSAPRYALAPRPSARPRPRRTCACVEDQESWTLQPPTRRTRLLSVNAITAVGFMNEILHNQCQENSTDLRTFSTRSAQSRYKVNNNQNAVLSVSVHWFFPHNLVSMWVVACSIMMDKEECTFCLAGLIDYYLRPYIDNWLLTTRTPGPVDQTWIRSDHLSVTRSEPHDH